MSLPLFHRCFHALAAFSAALLFAGSAPAATWILSNGDRLHGTLVAETDDAIEIEHSALGRLFIARSAIQGEVTDSLEPVAAEIEVTLDLPAAEGAPAVVAAPVVSAPSSPDRPQFKWLARQFELGYARQDGARNKEDITTRVQAEARYGAHSFRATARYIRTDADTKVVANRQEADFRWRHDFTGKLFAQSLTTYAADDIRRINLSLEQQLGGGYRLVEAGRQRVNVGLGAVVQRLDRDGYEGHTALLGSAFQDYQLQWNDRFRFTQEATLFVSEDGGIASMGGRSTVAAPADGTYRLKFNAGMQTKMTDQLSLNVRYEFDYDRSVPETILRSDSRLTTSLGFSW